MTKQGEVMKNKIRPYFNKTVALMSLAGGILSWFGCQYFYNLYHNSISGPLMIGVFCSILFSSVFLMVLIGSILTGSFDKESRFYEGAGSVILYFFCSLLAVFIVTVFLEYLYEINPKTKEIEATSYIFVIDESGSMGGNDAKGLRYKAIPEIMKAEKAEFPYMVYTFSDSTKIVKQMGDLDSDYKEIPISHSGGTAIRGTLLQILKDYKEHVWEGGEHPKVVLLTDGAATDLDNGFLWFKGNVPEFNHALEEYSNLGINISTVGLGSVDKKVMNKIAETTGGVFVNVKNASDLASAMKTAATSYSDRTLLSIRYMKNMDGLYGILRILFLTIIGTLIGSAVLFAYMDDFSVPTILLGSVTGALLGSILLEIGLKIGVFQSVLWLILWSLFSITFGYRYPKKSEELSSDSVMPQGRVTDYFIHD